MTSLSQLVGVAAVALSIVVSGASTWAQPATGAGQQVTIMPPASAQQPGGIVVPPRPAPPSVAPSNPAPAAATDTHPTTARPADGIGPLQELSPWSMFQSADILVKAVMLGLVFASLVTWTLFLAKTIQISLARRELGSALARIARVRSLSEAQLALGSTSNVLSELLSAAVQEVQLSDEKAPDASIKERAASRFSEIVRIEGRTMRSGMAIIATIGATAPFVGLFGTVWGIMNSFIGISKAQTTNLAVVAPGIAEALLATAIGLFTAIPAVIIYNHFSRSTKNYVDLVGRGSGGISRILSRDLDRFHARIAAHAAE